VCGAALMKKLLAEYKDKALALVLTTRRISGAGKL
jgi:hypothetical protein